MTDSGHVRLPHRLLEAIVSAPFLDVHYKIVLAIALHTIGAGRHGVSASLSELAALSGMSAKGGFRRALTELIEEGVVAPFGDGYALQQDYGRWGRFSQATAALEARRPRARKIRARVRFQVLKRDGYRCQYCGSRAPAVELHVDHVISRAQGGSDDPSNLETSCAECNGGKHAIDGNIPEGLGHA